MSNEEYSSLSVSYSIYGILCIVSSITLYLYKIDIKTERTNLALDHCVAILSLISDRKG